MIALSIVAPAVQQIIDGEKRIEVRSWTPSAPIMVDLALVENQRYLMEDGDESPGELRAFVDVKGFHPWSEREASTSGATWKPGYISWELSNVRELALPIVCVAKRKIYELDEIKALPNGLIRRW